MSEDGSGIRQLGSFRRPPADLMAVIFIVILTNIAVFAPIFRETPLRIILGFPLVLFLPGYAIVSAMFPRRAPNGGTSGLNQQTQQPEHSNYTIEKRVQEGRFNNIERLAFSFGLSIAVVAILVMFLNYTTTGIRLESVILSISGLTLGATLIAMIRRFQVVPSDRYRIHYKSWIPRIREELLHPQSGKDAVMNILIVIVAVLAITSIVYAATDTQQEESYTEFYLLTMDEGGELVANNYPDTIEQGTSTTLVFGVHNHEFEYIQYTIVIELQRLTVVNNTSNVIEETELERFKIDLSHNQTRFRNHSVSPPLAGKGLRLTYLLYKDEPPPNPSLRNAEQELHLWVNVSNTSQQS